MAKLRKFCAYRRLERPYTRTSKYRKKSFIRVRPHSKIVKYNMGDPKNKFPCTFDLLSKSDQQIRHNAIESGRLACNRFLEKNLGKKEFYFEIRAFPHHILRENPLASGAGADRMSTGMKMSFGKPIGVAAQLRIGSPVFTVCVNKEKIKIAREALKRASKKLPGSYSLVQREEPKDKKKVVKAKEEVKAEKPKAEKKPEVKEEKVEAKEEKPEAEKKPEVVEEPKAEEKTVEEAKPNVEEKKEEVPVAEPEKEVTEETKVEEKTEVKEEKPVAIEESKTDKPVAEEKA